MLKLLAIMFVVAFFVTGMRFDYSVVKFTFRGDPLQNALRGTLVSKVNFTGWGNPCQKYLRGRFGNLVKFTF